MPEMATCPRNVVCLAPFINPQSAGPIANRAVPIRAPCGVIFQPQRRPRNDRPTKSPQHRKSPFRCCNLGSALCFSNSRFLTDCYSFLPQFSDGFSSQLPFTLPLKPCEVANVSGQPAVAARG